MASWHQQKAWKRDGFPKLNHPEQWSSYNPNGHMSIMRHESKESCFNYCAKTGDIPLPPDNLVTRKI